LVGGDLELLASAAKRELTRYTALSWERTFSIIRRTIAASCTAC
jgi:hypothetical protein